MKKIVINSCYGGFGLSREAVMRYAELKGITLYPEMDHKFSALTGPTYYTKPKNDRNGVLAGDAFHSATLEERKLSNARYSENVLTPRDIKRDDAALVQVVEELGEKSSDECAKLSIVEIPDGVEWGIEEYDGYEHVAEIHRTWP